MPKKILAVDDEPDVLTLVQLLLEGAGFDVVTAKDGPEGFSKAIQFHPDLALIDVVMPGMTGIELLEKMKSEKQTQTIPVVVFTVLDREVDRRMALDLDAVDFITKPRDPQEILSFVKRIKNLVESKSEKGD
jgi:DNA-binding response OmpR family regulator